MKKLLLTTFGLAVGLGAFSQTIVGTTPSNKNVILEELTGKTCTYCPDGHKRAQALKDANPGRVVVLNIHTGGYAAGNPNYRTTWGDYVGGLFSVTGYPTGAINRADYGSGVMHSRGDWATNAANVIGQLSPVNVGGTATIDLDTRMLTVDVEAYYTAAGPGSSNKMNVIIMQNNIAGPQTGGTSFYPAQILPNGDYNHNHMVRHTLTPDAGDNIANISATALYTDQMTYSIPTQINNIPVNMADLEVAVYVSEGTSTGAVISGNYAPITFVTTTPIGVSNGAAAMDASLGAVCGTSVGATMLITNMGNTALTTATIEYTVNSGTPGTYQHTFATALQTGHYEAVTIPSIPGLTAGGVSSNVDLSVTLLNGATNPNTNTSNGNAVSTAATKQAGSTTVTLELSTDRYGAETTWELVDETAGSTVMSGGPYTNAAANGVQVIPPVSGTIVSGNCYKFIIKDSYGDGINGSFGAGTFSLKAGSTVLSSGGTFTNEDGAKFVFDLTVGIDELNTENGVSISPNPTTDISTISFELTKASSVKMQVINSVGSVVVNNSAQKMSAGSQKVVFDGSELPTGIYFVNLTIGEKVITKKVSLTK